MTSSPPTSSCGSERQAATHCYPGMDFSVAGIGELLASVPELRRIYEFEQTLAEVMRQLRRSQEP